MSAKFTQEQIIEIIIEWAEQKAKNEEIKFDRKLCKKYNDHFTVRYLTPQTTNLIPNNSEGKNTGFEGKNHYAFEIECRQEVLHLLLTFSYKNITDETKKICEEILDKYKMYRIKNYKKPTGAFRGACSFKINISKCQSKEAIITEMNKYFYMMKGYEEFICHKLQKEKA